MSKDKISDYSATANSNTDIGGINIDEGCAPSGINDAIRTLMKQLKDFQQGTNSDSFNGPVGATTASTGAFTTLSASSTLSVTGAGTIQGLTVGKGAGAVSTNTAVGASALAANTSGLANAGFGNAVLFNNTSGQQNTAVGHQAIYSNTTGGYNAGLGTNALFSNSTGTYNTAHGAYALYSNTTASNNTAVGYQALYSNTTASYNTALGYQAGYSSNHTANANGYNVLIGFQAGYALTTGSDNCFVGSAAGAAATTGTNNTFVGANTSVGASGAAVTTGSKNTILGGYSGNQGSLDIRTANNYIVLSDGDGNPRAWWGANGAGTNWACAKSDGDITMYYGPADLSPNASRSSRMGFITSSSQKNWYIAHNWFIGGGLEFYQTTTAGGSTMSSTAAFYLNSSGNGVFTGSLSKGSGSFRIDHPLPELEETHHLVHSFIEGPQADLIYRGKVNLVAGRAEVNIDLASGMTDGTFVALCREVQCFTTNESDWVHVRGSVSGNVLTIEAQDPAATSLISWMVIGERQDKHMIDTDWTDDNGKVIVEPLKPPKIERKENVEVQA